MPDLKPAPKKDRGATALLASTGLTAAGNYAFTLLLLWILSTRGYTVFTAGSALLLLMGTLSSSSVPWVLAQEVASGDALRARSASGLALFAAFAQGLVASGVAFLVSAPWASLTARLALALATAAIFFSTTVVGYLQGQRRFGRIALAQIGELLARIGVGSALALSSLGPAGALTGFLAGSLLVTTLGLASMRSHALPRLPHRADSALLRRALGQLTIQGSVAALAGCDVLIAAAVLGSDPSIAGYQVANVLSRAPMFISVALSMVAFARLASARSEDHSRLVDLSLRTYVSLATPAALLVATVPQAVWALAVPGPYEHLGVLVTFTAISGWLIGAINLLTTQFQAVDRFAAAARRVLPGLVALFPVATLAVLHGGMHGLALGVLAVYACVFVALRRTARASWGAVMPLTSLVRWVPAALLLALFHHHLALWSVLALLVVVSMLLTMKTTLAPASDRLRVLHLGYEDPSRPGAGGGSVRTHEINSRLATHCDITVLVAKFPGCEDYTLDGVRYVHVGASIGHFGSLLAYFAVLPWSIRRRASDLVVEDFGAPFSSIMVPWITPRPVVGVVQWLFAREKSTQYRLPFHWVEALGLRSHRRLIAVSEDLATELRRRNPRAQVLAIPNGLPEAAFTTPATERSDLLYLGRLECAQKGLDLLLTSFAAAAPYVEANLLLAGDGPDEDTLRARVTELGLTERVRFLGRIPAEERFALLAAARLVVMPSRYETFGMVAAEAAAQSTPVLAFEIPCLRSLVEENGVLVPAFDTTAYTAELIRLADDAALCAEMGSFGPQMVESLRWDTLATTQLAVYRSAAARTPSSQGLPFSRDEIIRDDFTALASTRSRRLRVLLVGNYGNGNTGDEAICARLSDLLAETDLTVISRDPANVAYVHGLTAVRTLSWASLKALLTTDVLAIGGGGMFGAGLPVLVRVLPLAALAARLLGKKTAFLALGAYASTPRLVQNTLRLAARLSFHVSVRDDESYLTLTQGLFAARGVHLVDDPAVALETAPSTEVEGLLASVGVDRTRPLLVLSVKPSPDAQETRHILDALTAAAQEWISTHDGEVVALSLSTQGDYGLGPRMADAVLARQIATRLSSPARLKVVGPSLCPRLAKGLVAAADLVVGVRLHAQIFATSTSTPLIGLTFEAKARAWLRATSSPDIPAGEIAASRVRPLVRCAPSRYETLSLHEPLTV